MLEMDQLNKAKAMLDRGVDLADAGKHAEAMAVFSQLVTNFGGERPDLILSNRS